MWRLLWLRKRSYEAWVPVRYVYQLATDCPFQFTVYRKGKNKAGKTYVRVKLVARPSVIYGYMHKKGWMFTTQDGMVYEIVEGR